MMKVQNLLKKIMKLMLLKNKFRYIYTYVWLQEEEEAEEDKIIKLIEKFK